MEEELYCGKCFFHYYPKLRRVTKPKGWDSDLGGTSPMRWCPIHEHVRSGSYMLGTDALTKEEIKQRIKTKKEHLDKLEKLIDAPTALQTFRKEKENDSEI